MARIVKAHQVMRRALRRRRKRARQHSPTSHRAAAKIRSWWAARASERAKSWRPTRTALQATSATASQKQGQKSVGRAGGGGAGSWIGGSGTIGPMSVEWGYPSSDVSRGRRALRRAAILAAEVVLVLASGGLLVARGLP